MSPVRPQAIPGKGGLVSHFQPLPWRPVTNHQNTSTMIPNSNIANAESSDVVRTFWLAHKYAPTLFSTFICKRSTYMIHPLTQPRLSKRLNDGPSSNRGRGPAALPLWML